ncbi:hypothetical protein FGO68_gene17633 [Halteria grandinella]|uniref:Uncharacterized protein n=1 Tax=Halteria grandinella TaxID=5974 RepID=A0A8J8NNI0_HALGN|nr:hypothetical protein FGO68_gene17633 [Halteria grandinella]
MEQVDHVICEICRILAVKEVKRFEKIMEYLSYHLILLGIFCNALLYFYLVMDAKGWEFKLIWQIAVYIGFLIGVLIQQAVIFAIFLAVNEYSSLDGDSVGNVFVVTLILEALAAIGIYIWKLIISIKSDPQLSNPYIWHAVGSLVASIIAVYIIDYFINRPEIRQKQLAKKENFLKFRLNK